MAEYIEREKAYSLAKKIVDAIESGNYHPGVFAYDILDWIDDLPAADVRLVVLCRDCKYAPIEDKDGSDLEWPFDEFYGNPCPYKCLDNWYSRKPAPDFFCAAGEKKEES